MLALKWFSKLPLSKAPGVEQDIAVKSLVDVWAPLGVGVELRCITTVYLQIPNCSETLTANELPFHQDHTCFVIFELIYHFCLFIC